jgi:hypothetical protein
VHTTFIFSVFHLLAEAHLMCPDWRRLMCAGFAPCHCQAWAVELSREGPYLANKGALYLRPLQDYPGQQPNGRRLEFMTSVRQFAHQVADSAQAFRCWLADLPAVISVICCVRTWRTRSRPRNRRIAGVSGAIGVP